MRAPVSPSANTEQVDPEQSQCGNSGEGACLAGVSMPRWGEGGELVSSGRRGGCALVGGSAPVGRGADSRGEWVLLSRGPPIADVPGPWGSGGVSPTGQLYQRD